METVCPKCSKYKSCKSPCYPVKQFLAEDNLSVFEKTFTKETGETVSIIYARSRETPETALNQKYTGEPARKSLEVFSTEHESPFSSFQPGLKITGIFIDRFFHKFTFQDIADKYEIHRHTASSIYHNAVNRVIGVLEAMDRKEFTDKRIELYKKRTEQRSGNLPKGQRYFLLNKLFGMRPSEIASLEGMKGSSSIRQLIIRVSDQLKAGEISLIETTPEETGAAKARLDTHRKKRRKRYAK